MNRGHCDDAPVVIDAEAGRGGAAERDSGGAREGAADDGHGGAAGGVDGSRGHRAHGWHGRGPHRRQRPRSYAVPSRFSKAPSRVGERNQPSACTASVTLTVTPVNDAPQAAADTATTRRALAAMGFGEREDKLRKRKVF